MLVACIQLVAECESVVERDGLVVTSGVDSLKGSS